MQQFNFSDLSLPVLQNIVELKQKSVKDYDWLLSDNILLSDEEILILRHVKDGLVVISSGYMEIFPASL